MVALTVFLLVCDISISAVLLILVVWALVLLAGLFLTCWKRDRQMRQLLDMAGQLSERYLISEVMELPEQAEKRRTGCPARYLTALAISWFRMNRTHFSSE